MKIRDDDTILRIDARPHDGEALMRRDRDTLVLLEKGHRRKPVLTLYRWSRPTITVGYAQRAERDLDVGRLEQDDVPVVRRPTGGRAIYHDEEWTYSVAARTEDPTWGGDLWETYGRIGLVLRHALAALGIDATPPGPSARRDEATRGRETSPACFALTLGHELTVAGRKLVGSAQRRLTAAYLQQGSILVGESHLRLADYLLVKPDTVRATLRDRSTTVSREARTTATYESFAKALEFAWLRANDRVSSKATKA